MTKKNQQSMNSTSARPMGKGLLLSVIPLLLAGCGALQPVPYSQDEIQKRVSDDRSIMYSAQEPISKPVTESALFNAMHDALHDQGMGTLHQLGRVRGAALEAEVGKAMQLGITRGVHANQPCSQSPVAGDGG